MSDIELNPCRFCGCEIINFTYDSEYSNSNCAYYCDDCGAEGPSGSTIKEAAEKWNSPSLVEAELRARIVELEEQLRWIPISERLPENGEDVAALSKHDNSINRWHYFPGLEMYFTGHYSHWRPWPKLPEATK